MFPGKTQYHDLQVQKLHISTYREKTKGKIKDTS